MSKAAKPDDPRVLLHRTIKHSLLQASMSRAQQKTVFDVSVPRSLQDMLQTIREYELVSDDVIFVGVLYIQRLLKRSELSLTLENVRALFLVGVLVSSKFIEDVPFDNLTFARLGGLAIAEVNRLELAFLKALDFDLQFQPDVLKATEQHFRLRAKSRAWEADRSSRHTSTTAPTPASSGSAAPLRIRQQPANA